MKQVGQEEIHWEYPIGKPPIKHIHIVTQEEVDEYERQLAQQEKDNIKQQLEELDKKMNPARVLEDLIEGIEPNQRVLDIIAEKKALRAKLKE